MTGDVAVASLHHTVTRLASSLVGTLDAFASELLLLEHPFPDNWRGLTPTIGEVPNTGHVTGAHSRRAMVVDLGDGSSGLHRRHEFVGAVADASRLGR